MPKKLLEKLTLEQIPEDDCDFKEIIKFAYTFDGYEHFGSHARCADVANSSEKHTIEEIRASLFFEQRRWRHFGEAPDDEAQRYQRGLVRQLRELLMREGR